jgi:hypothetical protein
MIRCSSPAFELGIFMLILIDRCRRVGTDLLYLSLGSCFSRSLTFSSRALLSSPAERAAGCIAVGGPHTSGTALEPMNWQPVFSGRTRELIVRAETSQPEPAQAIRV